MSDRIHRNCKDDCSCKVKFLDSINYHSVKNSLNHHTEEYSHVKRGDIVIRRGQPFKITINLIEDYSEDHNVNFIFRYAGVKPNFADGTLVTVPLLKSNETTVSWKAVLETAKSDTLTVDVTPSPHCIVGEWTIAIEYTKYSTPIFLDLNKRVFILFNPWCEEDQVYLESKEWRNEAVLNTHGLIWKNAPPSDGIFWNYSQFETNILECALYCISKVAKLSPGLRSDPVLVSRALSAAINSNDDKGVIIGNWSGNYFYGVAPSEWTGSAAILQQYYKNKSPVRYGQCWVFAGVLTTVCRALGLPARPVTNFESAHDANGSISIEFTLNKSGSFDRNETIWNFHVWTEAWMDRPDLGKGNDGWQVIDATAQERSNGVFQCGPAPVAAVKNGDIHKSYDVGFVFSEVNADVVYLKENRIVKIDTSGVGKNISTKAPGCDKRLDLTNDYKFDENSQDERAVYIKAMRQLNNRWGKNYLANQISDVDFKLEYKDNVTIGETFNVTLTIENTTKNKLAKVTPLLRLDAYSIKGKHLKSVKTRKTTVLLKAGEKANFKMEINYDDYKKVIRDDVNFVVSCMAGVDGTNYTYYDRDDFRIVNPSVEVTIDQDGGDLIGIFSVKNPLPINLTGKRFLIDVPKMSGIVKLDVKDDVPPGKIISRTFNLPHLLPGRYTIAAKFVSKELSDIDGYTTFLVE